MDSILNTVNAVNKVLWDYILLFLLCGTGIYFTVRLKFIQVRKFLARLPPPVRRPQAQREKAGLRG